MKDEDRLKMAERMRRNTLEKAVKTLVEEVSGGGFRGGLRYTAGTCGHDSRTEDETTDVDHGDCEVRCQEGEL